jgi:hypothetical protein
MRYYEVYCTSHVIQLIAEPHISVLWGCAVRLVNHNVNVRYKLVL